MRISRSWFGLAHAAQLALPTQRSTATSGRRPAHLAQTPHGDEGWEHSVPEDSPGPRSGTGPRGAPTDEGPGVVPEDSPGPRSGTRAGVPLAVDEVDVPEDSPGPRSGTGPDGVPYATSTYAVLEESPGPYSGTP